MTKADIAQEFINQHPGVPSRTLARELRKAEPAVFHTDDAAYKAICYVRGTCGKEHRKRRGISAPQIPDSYEENWMPFNLEVTNGDVIAKLSDIHIPYHTKKSLELAIAEAKRRKSNIILLNGDTMDCYQMSKFERDPRCRNTKQEVEAVRQFLAFLRDRFPKARIIWKDGNHDERYESYLRRCAPELLGIDVFEKPSVLKFGEIGVEWVTEKRPIVCGKLTIVHGHEFAKTMTNPVNPARGLFLQSKVCAYEGHYHQTSEHAENSLEGKSIACWSSGCLCDLHPRYMPINKWNHGFGIIAIAKEGNFRIHNHKIINGEIY